jgi:thiol:disulfide interchange protein DsbC
MYSKFLARILAVILLVSGAAFAGQAKTDGSAEAAVKAALKAKFAEIVVDSVRKTPYDGLYEFVSENQVFYTDRNVNYIVLGRLIDTKSRRDLTEERMRDLMRVKFDSLPLDDAIKIVKGNGKRRLAVFSDPDCPYCKRLEGELDKINDVTLYFFLYPIDGLHPGATQKAKAVWCAPDRAKAWNDLMHKGIVPQSAACNTPVEKIRALGAKLKITGTPTLIFSDGQRVPGAIPADQMEKLLAGK